MSVESYSALDESSLRALLDGTVDLDERRLIRSAIRELRTREIEDMEAALTSKRFRPTRLKQQEDKENQHRSESNENLDILSRKLQSIQDIDELTKMLRAAAEYEERKMIRAAIRQIRDEQQQGTVERVKAPGRCLDPESVEPQGIMGIGMGSDDRMLTSQDALAFKPFYLTSCQTAELYAAYKPALTIYARPPIPKSTPYENPDQICCGGARFVGIQARERERERGSQSSEEKETENHSDRERVRSQIRELQHGQQTQQSRELQRRGSNSGMVLVLDHLVKEDGPGALLIQPQREDMNTEPDLVLSHRQRSDSSASDRSMASVLSRSNQDSVASENSLGSAYRARLDSGASDRSLGSSQRARLDSGASEQSVSSLSHVRQRLGSDVSDSGVRPRLGSGASDSIGPLSRERTDSRTSDLSVSMSSEGRGPGEEVDVAMSGSSDSTDSESESRSQEPASLNAPSSQDSNNDEEQPDGANLSRSKPANGLLSDSMKGLNDFKKQKITDNRDLPLTHDKAKDSAPEKNEAVLGQFNKTNSVRDRMRKFTESGQSPSVTPLKSAPLRNGTTSGSSGQTSFSRATERFTHTAASLGTSGDSTSRTSVASQSQAAPQPKGGASKPLSAADQSLNCVGGTRHPAEKDVHAYSNSKEDSTQGRAAGQQVTQGEADPDMKTFLTIEIKDGRTTTSSTSTPRGNIVPITNMTPRIVTNALGQRPELTLGLRATPFKISSSGLSSGSSIKIETEPVMASEPVFSSGPSVQVPCQVPAIPNGSSAQAKPAERSGKLTDEQLAAIEDEELLDKMLDESKDFEERKMIRAAMRDLRKRKRDQREKERETRLQDLRQQREERSQKGRAGVGAGEMVMRKVEKSADGSTLSQVTKTNRFAQSDDGSRLSRSTVMEASYVQKTDRGTVQSKSYSFSSSSPLPPLTQAKKWAVSSTARMTHRLGAAAAVWPPWSDGRRRNARS
ncbi:unnamed protein product [Pleuronectes platessa]|uniref:Smoothelin domain-containing protein n=1 Tax=Pleuronectes platessa TaxID=8262 RepID=A0A9N7UZG3_PLEPL|nr:unnamed protein product [Pleuronectes platessa]